MRRRLRLAALIALFTLGVFPHASSPATAAPASSGHIVAREVTVAQPALSGGTRSIDRGIAVGPDSGSTGGGTLLFTSDPIAAGQLFDRVGIHWVAQRGTEDSLSVELRTSADGTTWNSWAAVEDLDDLLDVDRNEHYGAIQLAADNARYAQYRVWMTGGDPSALERVGVTFMDVTDLNAGPLVRLGNDLRGAGRGARRELRVRRAGRRVEGAHAAGLGRR